MSDDRFKVLLIEDNPDDARLVREMLSYANEGSFDLECVDQLPAGLERLGSDEFDVVLLDLGLQGGQENHALARTCAEAPLVPVVVLTSIDDDSAGLEAVRAGAQDYVVKGWTDSNVLSRAIRYAIERKAAEAAIRQARELEVANAELARRQEQQERELRAMERLTTPTTAVASRMYGSAPIRKSLPIVFQELSQEYGRLLELALEQQAHKVEHDISVELTTLAERMGSLRMGPRDVIDVHSQALRTKIHEATSQKAKAYLEEGRLMVLKLMGYLASHYRNQSFGASRAGMAASAIGKETQNE